MEKNDLLDYELLSTSKVVKEVLINYLKVISKYEDNMDYGNCLISDYEKECIYAAISSAKEIINEME